MLTTLKKILQTKNNILTTILLSVLFFFFFLMATQFQVVLHTLSLFSIVEADFWSALGQLIRDAWYVTKPLVRVTTIFLSLATAINIVVYARYIRTYRRTLLSAGSALSASGVVLGMLTAGCLSCSVVVLGPLAAIIGFGATTWITHNTLLISIISLLLVLASIAIILKKIRKPQVCEIIDHHHE